MSYNLYGSIGDQFRKLKTFTKAQHNNYDYHTPNNPFTERGATFDPTNLKQHKRFNYNQGMMEEHIDYLKNPYKKEPTIAYFQAKIPPYIANREMRGNIINYNTMTSKLGWN